MPITRLKQEIKQVLYYGIKYSHVQDIRWYLPRCSYDMDVLRVCEEGHDIDRDLLALL